MAEVEEAAHRLLKALNEHQATTATAQR